MRCIVLCYLSWDTIINKDIKEYYERGLNLYQENISSFYGVIEQEEIIKKIYEFKTESMNTFNTIFTFNQDTFNNSEYLSWYNNSKRNLDAEITKHDTELISDNETKSAQMCKTLVEDSYSEVYC